MKKLIIGVVLVSAVCIVATAVSFKHQPKSVTNVSKIQGHYLALGDSVAAGIGLADYSDSSACNRTKQAYPNLVATKLNYQLTSIACSGATTTDGLVGLQDVNQLAVPAQITAVSTASKPKLITITVGANDTRWTSFIQKCYTASCGSDADTAVVEAGIAAASDNLKNAFSQIKNAYPTSQPPVVLSGYYKLFAAQPTATGCTETINLDANELVWIRQLQTSIDDSLQTVASQFSFVKFVPLSFAGHELCTDTPWVQGLTAKAPFHPTDAGQKAIADQIIAAVQEGLRTW